jgi:hypothetical protein
MKKTAQKFSLAVILITAISFAANATNVSGGIYSNTTWTLANSPYIVVDTVVVFPGVTLTIEPGVVVKFEDNKRLELRQATILAVGTITDSIIFTSNSTLPGAGIWDRVWLNGGISWSQFNYCHFEYAQFGIETGGRFNINNSNFFNNTNGLGGTGTPGSIDSCNFRYNTNCGINKINSGFIRCCNFSHNLMAIKEAMLSTIQNCVIDSNQAGGTIGVSLMEDCKILFNQTGVGSYFGDNVYRNCTVNSNTSTGIAVAEGDSVINCEIKYNGIGLDDTFDSWDLIKVITGNSIESNSIGIALATDADEIYCNRICNNSSYGVTYSYSANSNCLANNFWCSTDSAMISSFIYDGYDDISLWLLNFMPIDTLECYLASSTGIHEEANNESLRVFPNPFTDQMTVLLPAKDSKAAIKIYNVLGEEELNHLAETQKSILDVSGLAKGIHVLEITAGNKTVNRKIIKQ